MNWEQLKTVLWLRWRLTRNQWARSGGMLGAVIAVATSLGAVALGGLCFVGALLGAAFGLGEASPKIIMAIWFGITVGFLFFWMIGLLTELQRSETIDLQRLMHLPVALGQMFVVNYLVSHFAFSIIVAVPVMLGLGIGLAFARGPEMVLLVPLALSMVFMITAWTYCLRGWLATLMSNPRRRRTVIMGITFTFILLSQGPNLYFNILQRGDFHHNRQTTTDQNTRHAAEQEKLNQLLAVRKFIPPLWLPLGAEELAEGRVLPALLGTLGCLGIGALGLRRAYRSTVSFYYGQTGGQAPARIKPAGTAAAAGRTGRNRQRISGTAPARRAGTGRCARAGNLPFPVSRAGSKNGAGKFVSLDGGRRGDGFSAFTAPFDRGRKTVLCHRRGCLLDLHAGSIPRQSVWPGP